MNSFGQDEIASLEKRFRANLINSISGFKSANLIATRSKEGVDNLAVFSSVVHLGAHPPLLGFIMRPTSVERHTYDNIIESGFYTINSLPAKMKAEGHKTSAKFAKNVSEFDATEFKPEANDPYPPFVAQSPIKILLEFKSDMCIKENDTHLIIGEIISLKIDEDLIGEDGFVDLAKAGSAAISGLDAYHQVLSGTRFSYARPDEEPKEIKYG